MKVLILFSGGLDSIGLALFALQAGHDVHLLHLNYPHPAQIEERVTSERASVRLSHKFPNQVTYSPVNHGIIAAEMYGDGARYVPMRNLSFLGVAANWAVAYRCKEIWIGATSLDQEDYADCRPEFLGLFKIIVQQQLFDIPIRAPYLEEESSLLCRDKVREYCLQTKIPWISCYEPWNGNPCGVCNSCLQ